MGLGPIPFFAIVQYAAYYSLDSELEYRLIQIIKAMDQFYLKYESDKSKNQKAK